MRQLVDGLTLYHGSYTEVPQPDLDKCAKFKDFGQGFYLTTSFEQAKSFARLSLRKAKATGIAPQTQTNGWVSRYSFESVVPNLRIKAFATADESWLHCVVAHRKSGSFPGVASSYADFDVIAGKIANDQTNATITAYMSDTFGPMGSEQADRVCISLLLPERLVDQFCFRTEAALSCLAFEGSVSA